VLSAEDRVEQCNCVVMITHMEEELGNELTRGWKVIEVRLVFLSCEDETDDGVWV